MDKISRGKDRSRSELEKLRELTFKEKLEYIWNYYNYFIIGGIAGLVFIISLLTTCLNRPDIGLSIEWNAPYIEYEHLDTLADALEARLFDEESGKTIQAAISLLMAGDDPTYSATVIERTFAMLAAGTIDIFVVDRQTLINYSAAEYVLPLEDTLSNIRMQNPAIYEHLMIEAAYEEYGYDEEHTTDERLVGIRITDSPLIKGLLIPVYGEAYICIAITASNYENAMQTLVEFYR